MTKWCSLVLNYSEMNVQSVDTIIVTEATKFVFEEMVLPIKTL
jgi:hypothetical protein